MRTFFDFGHICGVMNVAEETAVKKRRLVTVFPARLSVNGVVLTRRRPVMIIEAVEATKDAAIAGNGETLGSGAAARNG